ncbi:hypothetical protein [Salipiger abyssi]|uniref:hypothetical protein n=1 Tax=Salipiger abyssi TaxID=1250539 RepID=UPI001A8DB988|nr:hypothetical protein [Salipiger abyssi]MBN9888603.1 hypothetical protein [Salipiger abyssi]
MTIKDHIQTSQEDMEEIEIGHDLDRRQYRRGAGVNAGLIRFLYISVTALLCAVTPSISAGERETLVSSVIDSFRFGQFYPECRNLFSEKTCQALVFVNIAPMKSYGEQEGRTTDDDAFIPRRIRSYLDNRPIEALGALSSCSEHEFLEWVAEVVRRAGKSAEGTIHSLPNEFIGCVSLLHKSEHYFIVTSEGIVGKAEVTKGKSNSVLSMTFFFRMKNFEISLTGFPIEVWQETPSSVLDFLNNSVRDMFPDSSIKIDVGSPSELRFESEDQQNTD